MAEWRKNSWTARVRRFGARFGAQPGHNVATGIVFTGCYVTRHCMMDIRVGSQTLIKVYSTRHIIPNPNPTCTYLLDRRRTIDGACIS